MHQTLGVLDWIVVAVYAFGMLAVGWYYSRRTKTADDYLLGGRTMRPWAVGVSLFVSLMSIISYLAFPGEMIKHGPMFCADILALPLVFVIVGWWIIPVFMRQKVTSAYEILETRLGLSVRMVGSLLFLSLRLMWMAVIIFTAVDKVLVPLLGWSPSATPWLCIAMGVVTVCYTSMGGLRAVIVTDVIQATLLFGAAVMTILLITFDLGGVGAWWPTEWAPNWDRFALGFAPDARLAVSSMMLSSLVWYVSTAGSDQLSIQRYLATRDAPAARRMYGISLASIALVEVFLALLGLALLAFFRAHPEAMGDPEMIVKKPDSLFLRFIAVRMPPGVTGLAVAALLATSMSALSAGLSSTCSVISVDLVDRFRRRSGESEGRHVWLVRCISWGVGALVIGLSLFVGLVPGNLFEVAGKVINLFVAPLFVLFVMALFVPWANTLGTLTGAAASLAAAVAVSLFEVGGLSFIWIQPVSLAVGIVVGTVVSLLPFGRRRPVETAEIDPQMQSEERL